ncbi:IS66 family insertion sequence element accessory protein TnpB [Rhizobium hidalgonense]|uniref:IS66 family insertion sequence element accessory protein TnpB n=1 Tax=Rhizobium hidalgonense TaxID=1538159 RepID=UPI0028773BC5|nr:IS66 family insertion sequence element accessory protein TnpB [Rhizobium hidalgonense]
MFRLGADLKVYLHREPIDFRAGINSLAVLVQETMALDPFAPAVFAFCNRRRDRVKLLFFDRSGFVLILNDLHSYCISLSHSVEGFGVSGILLTGGDAIDELVPSTALLLR